MVPDVALIDPETTTSMSPELTAATGMGALVHSFEAFASNAGSPITDMFALEAISAFRRRVGMTMTLGDIGVKASDIPQLAEYALVDHCLAANPRQPTIHDIETIYEKALGQRPQQRNIKK